MSALGPLAADFYAGSWVTLDLPFVSERLNIWPDEAEWNGYLEDFSYVTVVRTEPIEMTEAAVHEWLVAEKSLFADEVVDFVFEADDSLTQAAGKPVYRYSYSVEGLSESYSHGAFVFADDATFYVYVDQSLAFDDDEMSRDLSWLGGLKLEPVETWLGSSKYLGHLAKGKWVTMSTGALEQELVYGFDNSYLLSEWEQDELSLRIESREAIEDSADAVAAFLEEHISSDSSDFELAELEQIDELTQQLGHPTYLAEATSTWDETVEQIAAITVVTDDETFLITFLLQGDPEDYADTLTGVLNSLSIVEV